MYLTPFTNYTLILLPSLRTSQAGRKEKKKSKREKKEREREKDRDDKRCREGCGYLICAARLDSIGRGKPIKTPRLVPALFLLGLSSENTLSKHPNH